MDGHDYITQEDHSVTIDAIVALIEALRIEILNTVQTLEARVVSLEKQTAILTFSLGEQAAAIDALILTLVEGGDSEDTFMEHLNAAREKLLSVLQPDAKNQAESEATPTME